MLGQRPKCFLSLRLPHGLRWLLELWSFHLSFSIQPETFEAYLGYSVRFYLKTSKPAKNGQIEKAEKVALERCIKKTQPLRAFVQ